MTAGVVFDTYAWIEYIADAKHAGKISELLNGSRYKQKATPATAIAEITEKLFREGVVRSKIEQINRFIASKTSIIHCDNEVAFRAGELNSVQKKNIKDWGMLDSLNYAVARMLNCKFVTGDPHFRGFKDIIWIGQTTMK